MTSFRMWLIRRQIRKLRQQIEEVKFDRARLEEQRIEISAEISKTRDTIRRLQQDRY